METVFQYRLPVWHPQTVHFPIALLLTAVLVALIWAIRGRETWRLMLLLLLGLTALSGIISYRTGEDLLEQVEGTPIVDALVSTHETSALFAIIASGICFMGLVLYSVARRRWRDRDADPLFVRIVFLVLIIVAAGLMAWTAHVGGTMVWGVAR